MEKNCETCGGTGWVMRPSIPNACPEGCEPKMYPTDSVVSQGEKREVFDREQVTKFWLWLTRKANVEVIDAETAIEVHGYANSAGLVPVISFKELLDIYESETK